MSARSSAVGCARATVRAEVGECLCPYLTSAGSAQLRARLERQELSRHARPTSERPPAARENGIAAAIARRNRREALQRTHDQGAQRGRKGTWRGQHARRAALGREGVYAASEREGRKEGVAERVQRSRRWKGSKTAKEDGAGASDAEGQSTRREQARTEHKQGSGLGQVRGGHGRWKGSAGRRAWGRTDGVRTCRGRRRRR